MAPGMMAQGHRGRLHGTDCGEDRGRVGFRMLGANSFPTSGRVIRLPMLPLAELYTLYGIPMDGQKEVPSTGNRIGQ